MAKGKKESGKTSVSKGERRSSISTKNTDPAQRMLNQLYALMKGKNVVMNLDGKKQVIDGKKWMAKRQGIKTANSGNEDA